MLLVPCFDASAVADVVGAAMLGAQRTDEEVAIVYVEILSTFLSGTSSNWELVMGDIGLLLSDALGPSSFCARSSISEFVVILTGADAHRPSQVCSRIVSHLSSPLPRQPTLRLSVNVGFSVFPHDGDTVHDLMRSADAALYRSKVVGRGGYAAYSSFTDVTKPKDLERDVRQAWERGEFVLSFQPIVDASSQVKAFEALVRWHHPDSGIIGPDVFIPVCESTGLVVPLGEWILETALRQYREWLRSGFQVPRMAVNVSAHQLLSPGFVHSVGQIVSSLGLAPDCLEIELTESALVSDPIRAAQVIDELRACGFSVSLDDFGTGMNTLAYLKIFRVDALKIDRSFVSDLVTNERSRSIVSSMIGLAHSMGMTVVSEGVETLEQRDVLAHLGSDEFQGYFFSRPLDVVSAKEMLGLLSSRDGRIQNVQVSSVEEP